MTSAEKIEATVRASIVAREVLKVGETGNRGLARLHVASAAKALGELDDLLKRGEAVEAAATTGGGR